MSFGLALARDLASNHRAERCMSTITCDLCLIIEVLDHLDKALEERAMYKRTAEANQTCLAGAVLALDGAPAQPGSEFERMRTALETIRKWWNESSDEYNEFPVSALLEGLR